MNTDPKAYALIPAAGDSVRMASGASKALLKLGRYTVAEHSIRAIDVCRYVQKIIVMGRAADLPELSKSRGGTCPIDYIEGGAVRRESVLRGLEFIRRETIDTSNLYVLVHDAARCLVTPEIIGAAVKAAVVHRAVTVGIPAVDTLKRANEKGEIEATLERKDVWHIQTPQVFEFELLWKAHQSASGDALDDASLVEPLHPVHIVPGSRRNFKITTPEDFEIAQAIHRADIE